MKPCSRHFDPSVYLCRSQTRKKRLRQTKRLRKIEDSERIRSSCGAHHSKTEYKRKSIRYTRSLPYYVVIQVMFENLGLENCQLLYLRNQEAALTYLSFTASKSKHTSSLNVLYHLPQRKLCLNVIYGVRLVYVCEASEDYMQVRLYLRW